MFEDFLLGSIVLSYEQDRLLYPLLRRAHAEA